MAITRNLVITTERFEFTASNGNINGSHESSGGSVHFTSRADVDEFIAALRESSKIAFPA